MKGKSYTFKIAWTDTNRGPLGPDYDWQFLVDDTSVPGVRLDRYGSGSVYVVEDPQNLLTFLYNGDDINMAKGKTGKIHVAGIGFRTNGVFRTGNLAVAKWEDAFESFVDNIWLKPGRDDFINDDADRFQIFLNDARRTEGTLEATVTQSGSVADSRTVTLYRQPDGTYLSTNLLIVADAEDRVLDGISHKPANASERMFTMALEDTLTVSYTHGGGTLTSTATVGVDIKTLHVDVAVMTTNGVPVAKPQRVEEDMKAMQERYAQMNIKINWAQKTFAAPPAIAADPTDWCVNTSAGFVLTDEAKAVIDASGLNAGKVRVIYVPEPLTYYDTATGGTATAAGYAITRHDFHNDGANYVDTCFVTAPAISNHVPAHEVGHLLWLDHHLWRWNLMYKSIPTQYILKDPRTNKRLTQGQLGVILMEFEDNPKLK